jgi:hypothetical protein
MLSSEVITELSELDPLEPEWDELAVANRLPLMSPACVMAWWRHLSPPSAEPRIVAVRDGDQLVGLAPFYVYLRRWGGGLGLRLPGCMAGLLPSFLSLEDEHYRSGRKSSTRLRKQRPVGRVGRLPASTSRPRPRGPNASRRERNLTRAGRFTAARGGQVCYFYTEF